MKYTPKRCLCGQLLDPNEQGIPATADVVPSLDEQGPGATCMCGYCGRLYELQADLSLRSVADSELTPESLEAMQRLRKLLALGMTLGLLPPRKS